MAKCNQLTPQPCKGLSSSSSSSIAVVVVIVHCVHTLCPAGIQMTDPHWYQQLVSQLSAEQRKDLDDILQFSDHERSVQSPCLAALLSAPVV